ncbi:MAG TPA: hypothetical protein VG246_00135 [Acidimicrobiales bacterium]|nr:hypothetical protein [Acidimicrobiales bacterium]
MKFARLTLIGIVLLASALVATNASHAVTTTTTPSGLPLYQFVNTGVQPLPWNAVSLESHLSTTTMLGGPHSASTTTEGVIAYRTNAGDLARYLQTSTGATSWLNYTTHNNVPTAGGDPVPFFDPSNNVDLLYVDTSGHLELLTPNNPDKAIWARLHFGTPWRPFVTTDLTALTGVNASVGLPSVQVNGTTGTIAYRTASNTIEVLTLSWQPGQPVPVYSQDATTVKFSNAGTVTSSPSPAGSSTVATSTAPTVTTTTALAASHAHPAAAPTTTTTTTKPPTTTTTKPTTTTTKPTTTTTKPTTTTTLPPTVASGFASDPVVLPSATPSFATILNNGDVDVFTNTGTSLSTWTTKNLTTTTAAPTVVGTLALGTSAASIDLAALTAGGSVDLFTTQNLSTSFGAQPLWNYANITSQASGAPPLSGALTVEVTPTQVAVAGQASNWGDLFVLTNPAGTSSWTATNVSVTAGASARTVGNIVAGLQIDGQLTLYAAGINSPPPEGVGVYAIPSSDWSTAISNGWPIISETGGLGTRTAPWVGFTGTTNVSASPDFLLGQAIYNSHKRVTWLSFWTVSGPLAGQAITAANFYTHGFDAGVWVATQIASYRSLGVGLSPDWVVLDTEGYPDNHSGLDAPGGASSATLATYATYWSSMLKGWQTGIDSVDPNLNAAVYASQSEYRNYQLSTNPMPVFIALAFGGGGPVPVAGATGSNVRGFITFDAACSPLSTLENEATTLENPPWAGQFNTLQFNPGVYCPPPST